jgi:hypothetical protein
MPTVLRSGPYRLFFYSSDRVEPPHVHVERGGRRAKLWLVPVRLQYRGDFNRAEIKRVHSLVEQHQQQLLKAWHEFFTD